MPFIKFSTSQCITLEDAYDEIELLGFPVTVNMFDMLHTTCKVVIDGMDLDKKMYALKHTSAQFYVNENANADMKFLQQQIEHHSIAQTEIYLQDKIFKRIDETGTNMLDY